MYILGPLKTFNSNITLHGYIELAKRTFLWTSVETAENLKWTHGQPNNKRCHSADDIKFWMIISVNCNSVLRTLMRYSNVSYVIEHSSVTLLVPKWKGKLGLATFQSFLDYLFQRITLWSFISTGHSLSLCFIKHSSNSHYLDMESCWRLEPVKKSSEHWLYFNSSKLFHLPQCIAWNSTNWSAVRLTGAGVSTWGAWSYKNHLYWIIKVTQSSKGLCLISLFPVAWATNLI